MNVLMVQARFVDAVVSGRKPHTIRPHRSDGRPRARVGEPLSVRVWTGKPYRSKQREIARVVVTGVSIIMLDARIVVLPDSSAWEGWEDAALERLAIDDGFSGWTEMRDWFDATHGLPFSGVLIRWRLAG